MTELRDRLRDLVEPGRDIEWVWDDPVFGTPQCEIAECVRGSCGDDSNLCEEHRSRWRAAGRPNIERWDGGPPVGPTVIRLSALPEQVQLELRYGVQRARQRLVGLGMTARQLRLMVHQLEVSGVTSLLQHDEWAWPQAGGKPPGQLRNRLMLFTIDELDALLGISSREHECTKDQWRMRRLGLDDRSGITLLRFDSVEQRWLRAAIKKFLLWRLDRGRTNNGLCADLDVLVGLARTFTDAAGESADATMLTTQLVDRYLGSVTGRRSSRLAAGAASCVTSFLSYLHEHNLASGLAAEAVAKETPVRLRGLSDDVMKQLGARANLGMLPDRRWRLLFQLVLDAGLQIDDALSLEIDCAFRDGAGVPRLRYFNRDQACQAVIDISDELFEAISDRCDELVTQAPEACLQLFRDIAAPADTAIVTAVLREWLRVCEVRDADGYPMEITVAQFRYAIRSGSQRVVERTEPDDGPVVDVAGKVLEWRPPAMGTAELINGYCRLPAERSCPHPNACLTCPNFATTRHFLSLHREQLTKAERMIKRGLLRNETRLVEANQQVVANLANIITALRAR